METAILSEDFVLSNMETETNSIQFNLNNTEEPILKLCQNGDILVKGKLIENDVEVVNALKEFVGKSDLLRPKTNIEEIIRIQRVQRQLIDLYESQIADLIMMSKIELGDDVIVEIQRLKKLINNV